MEIKNEKLHIYRNKFESEGEIYLRIKVSPGLSKTVVRQILPDETIKIDIAAPPEKGKANDELIRYMAKQFEVSRDTIKIISGKSEKIKLIKIKLK